MDITVDLLIEVDKLIQLLESPIFICNYIQIKIYCLSIFMLHVNVSLDLRMELLKEPVNQYLIQALYGLLMIMPQSDAFHILRHRLKCVPHLRLGSEKCVLCIYIF